MTAANSRVLRLARKPSGAVTWREVLSALQDSETRSYAVSRIVDRGFSLDSLGHSTAARQTLAEALTAVEDMLEAKAGSRASETRDRVRGLRRRLELELWP